MAKRGDERKGYSRMLDAWVPPPEAGEPVGCLATTFTFSPVLFEEECLSRFLKMETDPDENGSAFLIEREEKMAAVKYLGVMIDQHHCRGIHNLRWDMIPFRMPRGILHAKIAILCWANHLRILVGSANLTEQGYRTNQEIFSALDFYEGSDVPQLVLTKFIDFLQSLAASESFSTDQPEIKRWKEFTAHLASYTKQWGRKEEYRGGADMRVYPILIGPGGEHIFTQLKETWRQAAYNPPTMAWITSPFFDPPEAFNSPASKIWEVLNQKGEAQVVYQVRTEDHEDEHIVVLAPESLRKAIPRGRPRVRLFFEEIQEYFDTDQCKGFRPLHIKSIWLQNQDWALYMIGSSNFSSAGTGIGRVTNYEANIAFVANAKEHWKQLKESSLSGNAIDVDDNKKISWQIAPDDEELVAEKLAPLPEAFSCATFFRDEHLRSFLRLQFRLAELPKGFSIEREDGKCILYDETRWIENGKPMGTVLDWTGDLPPSGLNVKWDGAPSGAWWPVNVDRQSSLPPPPELKDLPLDILIKVLTSARPIYQTLGTWIKRKETSSKIMEDLAIDPHKRVDTTKFLFQRTRQISWVLKTVREKLQKPFYTEEALHWRLRGPVGVLTLVNAILKEGRSEDEKAFLIAEIALELSRVLPIADERSLRKEEVQEAIKELIRTIRKSNAIAMNISNELIRNYFNKVFQELPK